MRVMCTAIVSIEPGRPLLLAGIRDELTDRAWQPPGEHWPEHPGVLGGLDLLAGGTWLAVAPAARRVGCVLNGRGRMARPGSRRSRGILPLEAADGTASWRGALAGFDPFHLITASLDAVVLSSWDGERLAERELGAGLHMIVNSGLAAAPGRHDELPRIEHFAPRLAAAVRPDPRPGGSAQAAWGAWLPLMNGDGLDPGDPRALVVRRDLDDGRIWGTTSISLVALAATGVRYDFTGMPGDPAAWREITGFP
jgi:hypothetical protein